MLGVVGQLTVAFTHFLSQEVLIWAETIWIAGHLVLKENLSRSMLKINVVQ